MSEPSKSEVFEGNRLQNKVDSGLPDVSQPGNWSYPPRKDFSWRKPLGILRTLGNRFMTPRNPNIDRLRSLARPELTSEKQEFKKAIESAKTAREAELRNSPPPGAMPDDAYLDNRK